MAGASHVVAHLLREVESALGDVLEVIAESARISSEERHKAEILSINRLVTSQEYCSVADNLPFFVSQVDTEVVSFPLPGHNIERYISVTWE